MLWCVSPLLLGHGATIVGDAQTSAMAVGAMYCIWRWLVSDGWLEAMVAGIALGLAELSKFTLLVFYPVLLIVWITSEFSQPPRKGARAQRASMLACIVVTSVLVINIGYVFDASFARLEKYRFYSKLLTGAKSVEDVPWQGENRFADTWLGQLRVPLPADFIEGIDVQRCDFERGVPSYLHGRWADHGWWYYYLYALAVKVPLGTWCLMLLAVGVTLVGRGFNAPWRDEAVLLGPGLAILTFVSSQTGFSVHSRYVLPALPFFLIWISKVGRVFQMHPRTKRRRFLTAAVVVCLTWTAGSCLWVYPHSLSYFNELVGGPKNGGAHLLSSNIDWGQDLFYLKAWLDKHPDVQLDGLALSASYPAALAGVPETPRPPSGNADYAQRDGTGLEDDCGPQPGWYALSVNYLYDRTGRYRYFLKFEPVASAGYSIYIYHITLDKANRVRAELEMPQLSDRNERSPR